MTHSTAARRVALLAGAALLAVSSFVDWIGGFLYPAKSAHEIPLGTSDLLSFGSVAISLSALAVLAWGTRRLEFAAGLGSILLVAFFPIHLSSVELPLMGELVDENVQYAQMVRFSRLYLPENRGVEARYSPVTSEETAQERLELTFRYARIGYYLSALGSLLLFTASIYRFGRGRRLFLVAIPAAALCGLIWIHRSEIVAAAHWKKAERLSVGGTCVDSLHEFERAARYQPNLLAHAPFLVSLGGASAGCNVTPAAVHLFRGDLLARGGELEASLLEYEAAVEKAEAASLPVMRRALARTRVLLGLREYRRNNRGGAIAEWTKATEIDPAQIAAPYFLSRALFESGQYADSIYYSDLVASRTSNPTIRANAYANGGDAHHALGRYAMAREYYRRSWGADPTGNFRVSRSLGGT
jgi:tetratricopeptide (TPR) repeat protein